MTIIKESDYEKIIAYSIENLPEEVCGIVGGIEKDGVRIILKVYFIENTLHSSVAFFGNVTQQIRCMADMRKNNMSMLGIFHSHPTANAYPSKEDIRLAYDDGAVNLILSLKDRENPVLRGFMILDGRVFDEQTEIIQSDNNSIDI